MAIIPLDPHHQASGGARAGRPHAAVRIDDGSRGCSSAFGSSAVWGARSAVATLRYADPEYVYRDLEGRPRAHAKLGCIVIHTEKRAVETAQEILRYFMSESILHQLI